MAPHLLSLKNWFFRHESFFWKFRKHLLRNFLVKWDEEFNGCRTENHDRRPLSYLKHFSIPELLWNTGVFLCETFRCCETKRFGREIVISHPPLIHKKFRDQENSETQNGASAKNFGIARQKKIRRKLVVGAPHLFSLESGKFLISKLFWTFRSFLQWNFLVKWDEEFHGRRTENRDRCLLFLSQTFFGTTNFVKHRGYPLRNVWVLGDKTISTENRDTSLLYIKFFHTRRFLKHRKVPVRKTSLLWDKRVSTENRDNSTPPSHSSHLIH